jgi:hypothetical protein
MRQTRRSRDELRRTLLEEGRAILMEEGLDAGSSNLTFKRVFERVEEKTGTRVTNASVIKRVWENQADFQADVLVSIARDEARPEVGGAVTAIAGLLGDLDLSSPESRAQALGQVCRVGGGATTVALAESTNWPLWISVVAMATATTTPEQQQRIKAALSEGYRSVSKFWSENFAVLTELLGLRIRRPFTLEQFTMAAIAYSEGCSLRQRTSDHIELVMRPSGPDGQEQEWSLFAVGLEGLVHQFFEPDPDFPPTTTGP